ncbi:hypothetical protein Poli38472_003453 [Pythium oligandrum]|uniref:FYVE-type domain-containing protein n=1 Tax=Pythium oligandrum TaxID=41045 RepID=A0A8K1C6W0_PYTOL|nr:hypothetical protein Poli38472_003453 [Pythium oligandrum]|eukprot:TMW57528.1 hypothetical protein Poli38472_003453 [Pythium oligandrum]
MTTPPPTGRPRGFSRHQVKDQRTRITQILADRSTLQLSLVDKKNWVDKKHRPHCYFCQRKFGPFNRKHHCRACGDVVCSKCNRRRDVQVGSEPSDVVHVRLCFDCIDKSLTSAGESDADDRSDSSVIDSAATPSDRLIKSAHSGSATTTRSTVTSMGSTVDLAAYESDASDRGSFQSNTSDETSSNASQSDDEDEEDGRYTTCSWRSASSNRGSHAYSLEFVPEHAERVDENVDLDEERRQAVLTALQANPTVQQREFDALCELACRALHCGVAAVSFFGGDVQWYKSRIGISQTELPRNVAFCSKVLDSTSPTIVLDVSQDRRFHQNPLVTGSAHIRFYASTPIHDPSTKRVVGTVFAMDPTAKEITPDRTSEVLSYLSTSAERLLDLSLHATKPRKGSRRARRVLSEPNVINDVGEKLSRSKSSETCSSRSTPSRTSSMVHLLDDEQLYCMTRDSSRWSSSSQPAESSQASVVARPRIHSSRTASPSPSGLAELHQQFASTQQLLVELRTSLNNAQRRNGASRVTSHEVEV